MSGLLSISVTANIVIFLRLGALAWSTGCRDKSQPIRSLAWALSLACWAFVMGAATDLALLGVRLRWLCGGAKGLFAETWHLGQSLAVTGLGMVVMLMIRRVDFSLRPADQLS